MEETYKDKDGYPIGNINHSHLIHRQVAYSEIYLKNRHKYPKKFSEYIVHHIDGNKENFYPKNLYICTQEQHDRIHQEQKRAMKRFRTSRQIDRFLSKPKKKSKEKKHECLDCGRSINHRGCCLPCNVERKRYREKLWGKEDSEEDAEEKKFPSWLKIIFWATVFLLFVIAIISLLVS